MFISRVRIAAYTYIGLKSHKLLRTQNNMQLYYLRVHPAYN